MTLFIYKEGTMWVDDRKMVVDRTGSIVRPVMESKVYQDEQTVIAMSGFTGDVSDYRDCVHGLSAIDSLIYFYINSYNLLMDMGLDNAHYGFVRSMLSRIMTEISKAENLFDKSFLAITKESVWFKDSYLDVQNVTNQHVTHAAGERLASILLANGVEPELIYAQCRRFGMPVGDKVYKYHRDDLKCTLPMVRLLSSRELINSLLHKRIGCKVADLPTYLFVTNHMFSFAEKSRYGVYSATTLRRLKNFVRDVATDNYRNLEFYKIVEANILKCEIAYEKART